MPAKDIYHDVFTDALRLDGWTITHDPYTIPVGRRNMFVDLGAEKLIAAERGTCRIAVENKSFQGPSDLRELETALGQYFLYTAFLSSHDPGRLFYLAVPRHVFENLFDEPVGRGVMELYKLRIVVIDPVTKEILQWIPPP